MLLLSRVIGNDVRAPDGDILGRLADLTVGLGEETGPHLVDRLVIRRRHDSSLLAPWGQVTSFKPGRIVLSGDGTGDPGPASEALDDDEILLARDVLDTQVVDVVGQRLARVADVVVARTALGALELVGVEVGFGGVLRRLGLGPLASRAGRDVIAWGDVHLTSERGHAVQLDTPRAAVHHLDARGLASMISRVDTESATEILAARGPAVAADVVRVAHPAVGERVLRAMPGTEVARIVAAMPDAHALRWRGRLEQAPELLGRRFLRFRVWPRRHHLEKGAS